MEQEEVGYVAMSQNSFLTSELSEETGYWKVTQVITQRRKVTVDSEWEEIDVTMSAESKDVDMAMAQVFLSMEGYLITRNHNLFNEPEATPVEVADGTVVH